MASVEIMQVIHESEMHLMLPKNYLDLPYDLSGSMAKNRFRFELLWGLYRIFDIYDRTDDFVVIFDYVCDVEVFTNAEDSFFQIKSKKETKPYTLNALCKQEKASDGTMLHSILGKLFLIKAKSDPERRVKLAIVSNVTLKHKQKEYTEKLEQPLVELDDGAKAAVVAKMKDEFGDDYVDMENVYYIRSFMDLANPQESVIGRMVTWFTDNRGCEVKNPKSLYLALRDLVEEKASYEWSGEDVADLQSKKGISKQQFDRIIDIHAQNAADGIAASEEWVKQNTPGVLERISALRSLTSIVEYMHRDERLISIGESIQDLLNAGVLPQGCDIGQAIVLLQKAVQDKCPPDYSPGQIQMLALITIKRMEENACP